MPKKAFFVLLLLAFLDSTAFGLIYPLFSSMLFDVKWAMVAPETSDTVRGMWVGLFISITPLVTMLVSPFVGNLSDRLGRRPAILFCLSFGTVSWLWAGYSVWEGSLIGVALARALMGFSVASFGVANAAVADMSSSQDDRGRRYSWMGVAFGLGFATGPFLGGMFSSTIFGDENLVRPFMFASLLTALNTLFVYLWLPETYTKTEGMARASLTSFFRELADVDAKLLALLAATFLFCFGWAFYVDFIPVWWVTQFHLSTSEISLYMGYGAFWYVLSSAFVVGRVIRCFPILGILSAGAFGLFVAIWILLFCNTPNIYWILLPLQNISASFLFPVAATAISQMAPKEHQGKIMGYHASAEALGFGIGPLSSGMLLGFTLQMPIILGGLAVCGSGLIACRLWRKWSVP